MVALALRRGQPDAVESVPVCLRSKPIGQYKVDQEKEVLDANSCGL
jgi:hypothetical protein